MTVLAWDLVDDRSYQTGIDRGVLYLSDSSGVVWNGLISVNVSSEIDVEAIYFDGRKIHDVVTIKDFEGTLKAFSYPEEFYQYQGLKNVRLGVQLLDQPQKRFGLSWRTMINDTDYKLHIAYCLLAIPSNRQFDTLSDSPSLAEFEWKVTGVPQDISGYRPTSYVCLDTTRDDPTVIASIESSLYGTESTNPVLPNLDTVVALLTS